MKRIAKIAGIAALLLAGTGTAAQAQQPVVEVDIAQPVSVPMMFAAINQGDWATAENLASQLDEGRAEGDLMLAFVYAARFIAEDNCAQGLPFARAVVNVSPGFLPAYDLVAACMVQENKAGEAAQLYRTAAERLDEGDAERDQLLARANSLAPDLSPVFTLEGQVQPSSNINRGTEADRIGLGKISDSSRRKSGVSVGAFGKVEKPVYATNRLFASVSLRAGASYLTHTKTFLPEAEIAATVRWLVTEKTIITTQAAYAYILSDDEFYASRPSLTFDVSHQLNANTTLGVSAGVTYNRMAANYLDGYNGFVGASATKALSPTDKVSLRTTFDWSERRIETQNYMGVGVDAEWEHLWANGFITSLGGGAYWRRYDALAPFTNERQVNKSVYGRVGLSHNKLVFGKLRPEITYTATKQWSNDVFSEHVAHDVGFRAKTSF